MLELPRLTPRQFLFAGRQSGAALRETLGKLGLQSHPVPFCRDMKYLEAKGFIRADFIPAMSINAMFRHRRYTVTDFGILQWLKTQKFYENLAPPPPAWSPSPPRTHAPPPATRRFGTNCSELN